MWVWVGVFYFRSCLLSLPWGHNSHRWVALLVMYLMMRCRLCQRFGRQSWIMCAIIFTEVLVAVKFEPQTVFKPIPFHMSMFWIVGIIGLFLFTVWKFYLRTHLQLYLKSQSKYSPKHTNNGTSADAPFILRRPVTRSVAKSRKYEWPHRICSVVCS